MKSAKEFMLWKVNNIDEQLTNLHKETGEYAN